MIEIKNQEDWWRAYGQVLPKIAQWQTLINDSDLETAFMTRDFKTAVKWMNEIWASLPDSRSIHSLPGFGQLCDLCSECWVFYE